MQQFDVGFIGGGPAGYVGAQYAAEHNLATVIFEQRAYGGVCLNEGCIPSKSLLYAAKLLDGAVYGAAFGVNVTGATLDQSAVIARKELVVSRLVKGVRGGVKNSGATMIDAHATIISSSDDGFIVEADEQRYLCRNLIVATGSSPVIPPIEGLQAALQRGFALTNREILNLTELPAHLTVVGGGVIGLEMACYFATAGSQVTVIEMLDRIANPMDLTIASALQKALTGKKIKFMLGTKVSGIEEGAVRCVNGEGEQVITSDKVLLSIGRKAVTQGYGLENLGVELSRGAIVTDECLRTNVKGLYACGDVNGKCMLAHVASREAEVAVNNILGIPDQINYDAIPSVVYTSPEVGSVGLSEQQAAERGLNFVAAELPLSYSGRYMAENLRLGGVCKVLAEKSSGKLLGIHVIGNYASEFIVSAAHLIDLGVTASRALRLIYPHPTVGEIIKEVLHRLVKELKINE